jgi:sugar phosphate isomerase/epimerase
MLTPNQVQDIQRRYAAGERSIRLAREFGVSRQTIHHHTVEKGVQRPQRASVEVCAVVREEEAAALREIARERGLSMSETIALAVRGLLALRRR